MAAPPVHPQGPFDQFIALMNHEAAKDLVRNINLFMKGFKQSAPDADADSRAVQGFLQQMETAMAKHPLFADTTPQEQDAATEALEKYLMTKLHERTFRRGADDVERDEALAVRCVALGFVRPEHLEIPPGVVDDTHLGRAVEELNKINKYKAPRDKLVCVLNCCSMINAQLAKSSKEGIGADDFTPLLIFVVIKAATPYLASNLAYIERYRYHPKLTAEAQYYYIQLCGAATFIEMINAQSLKVDRDEFIAHMLAAGAMSDEQLASLQSHNNADMAPAAATAATAAAADSQAAASSATQQNIHRSTQAAVAAATAAGIRVDDPQQQQQQQFPLQMQPLPTANSPASGWPQAALNHSSPGWPYQQQQQSLVQPPSPSQQRQQQQQPPQLLLPSVAELESQGAALLSQRDPSAAARQLVSRHPFCCSDLDSLSLGDVGQLLASYKELVLRHEALTAALEDWRQQQQKEGTGPPAASATAGAAGPPPPISAPGGDVLTPPTSTGGAEPVVLAPLSPAATDPASPRPAAAATAMAAQQLSEQPPQLKPQQQMPPGQQQQQQAPPALPAAAPPSQGVAPSIGTVAATAVDAIHPTTPPPAAAAAPPPPPPPSMHAGSAPGSTAIAASAAGTVNPQQQESNVDDLLQSLLSPSAAQPASTPTAVSEPPPQQQQQQQQEQQKATEDDDLFGLFQGRSSGSGGGSNTAAAGAPSLLD